MSQHTASSYTTGTTGTTGTVTAPATEYYTERTVARNDRPLDRVRWPAVLAGLFGALSILALLTVLGTAIGASTVDRNSDAGNYGLGAGIWGAISVLLAFAFGGWLAARTAAVTGGSNGMLQGAVVWMVTIGLLVYLVAGGIGAAARTAGSAASTAVQTVGSNPQLTGQAQQAATGGTNDPNAAANNATAAANQAKDQLNQAANSVTGEHVEQAASATAKGAWGTLTAMVLGLIAAAVGGYVGARKDHHHDVRHTTAHA